MSKFPNYPGSTFGESEVEAYLEELASRGWQVFTGDETQEFVVLLDSEKRITIQFTAWDKAWLVRAYEHGTTKFVKSAASLQSFSELMEIGRASCRERV